jgi:hypothetical protein
MLRLACARSRLGPVHGELQIRVNVPFVSMLIRMAGECDLLLRCARNNHVQSLCIVPERSPNGLFLSILLGFNYCGLHRHVGQKTGHLVTSHPACIFSGSLIQNRLRIF